jgi:hypothetical protein
VAVEPVNEVLNHFIGILRSAPDNTTNEGNI